MPTIRVNNNNYTFGPTKAIVPPYIRHRDILPRSATLGPSAPADTSVGTFRGLGFSTAAQSANFSIEIPACWDAVSDMTLNTIWVSEDGDALIDGETVKWNLFYRSITYGDSALQGNQVLATITHTQVGAGLNGQMYETCATFDYDDADQPLVAGDILGVEYRRDTAVDTYSGIAIVLRWELTYIANTLGDH